MSLIGNVLIANRLFPHQYWPGMFNFAAKIRKKCLIKVIPHEKRAIFAQDTVAPRIQQIICFSGLHALCLIFGRNPINKI